MGAVDAAARDGAAGGDSCSGFDNGDAVPPEKLTPGRAGCDVMCAVDDIDTGVTGEAGTAGCCFIAVSGRGRTGRSALRGSAASCPTPPSVRDPAARRAVRRSRSKGSSGSDIFSANHVYLFRFGAGAGGAGCAFCGEITARTRGVSPVLPDAIR